MFGPEHAQHCLLCAVSLWHLFLMFVWVWFVLTCSGATPVKRPIDEEVTPSIWAVFRTWQTISKSSWLHDECRFHSKLGDKYPSLSSFGCASQILMIRNTSYSIAKQCLPLYSLHVTIVPLIASGTRASRNSTNWTCDKERRVVAKSLFDFAAHFLTPFSREICILVTNRSFDGHDWANLQARVPRSLQRRPTSPHYICAEKVSDTSDMHTLSPRHLPVLLYDYCAWSLLFEAAYDHWVLDFFQVAWFVLV